MVFRKSLGCLPGLLALLVCLPSPAQEIFRVATYNVENYLDHASGTRPIKSEAARAKIRESILAMRPDVLALEEIGGTNELFALQAELKTNGVDLPNWECIYGFDPNIHVAVLTRFVIESRQPQTNDAYLLHGTRFFVSRGFAQLQIRVTTNYSFTLIAAHLKSKRKISEADESDMRLEEARILRQKIDACFSLDPNVNLIVLGDLNDLHNSPPVRAVMGRGKKAMTDTRPGERNGDQKLQGNRRLALREVTWTHFYDVEDTYGRIDYILLSRGMAHEWIEDETYIPIIPNWDWVQTIVRWWRPFGQKIEMDEEVDQVQAWKSRHGRHPLIKIKG